MSTSLRYRRLAFASLTAVSLFVAACGQGAASPSATASAAPSAAASESAPASESPSAAAAVPAPFDAGPVKIALVRQLGSGDYFEQWLAGAEAQAEKLGIELLTSDHRGDNAA